MDRLIGQTSEGTTHSDAISALGIQCGIPDAAIPGGLIVCRLKPGFPICAANDRMAGMLAYKDRDELLSATDGLLSHCLAPQEDIAELLRRWAALEDGRLLALSYKMLKKTGETISVQFMSIRFKGDVEEELIVSLCTDVTDVVALQAELDHINNKLNALMNAVPGGISEYEESESGARLLFFNDSMCALAGYSREEYQALLKDDVLALIHADDRALVHEQAMRLVREGTMMDCEHRLLTKNGELLWVHLCGAAIYRKEGVTGIGTVLLDVTAQKRVLERLRLSEEQYRIAASMDEGRVAAFDFERNLFIHNDMLLLSLGFEREIANPPYPMIEKGIILPASEESLIEFFRLLRAREPDCECVISSRDSDDKIHYLRMKARLTDMNGEPLSYAIITCCDVTEQREKETVYKKWQQSLADMDSAEYTLYRCNLSRDTSLDSVEGKLLDFTFAPDKLTFDERTLDYAGRRVHLEDRENYAALLNTNALIAAYFRGNRSQTLEYRELTEGSDFRWLRLTVDLVEYPDSKDIEAYLMYRDINAEKQEELLTKKRAETDPLTGALNRAAFDSALEELFANSASGTQHALIMLDLDGFKLVNDSFGHAAGDRVLIEVVGYLRTVLRKGDLLGRLGGDEFMLCLRDIPYDAVIEKKAATICSLLRKTSKESVLISASVGVAIYPRDGMTCEMLYRNADLALYQAKKTGKNNFVFYNSYMADKLFEAEADDDTQEPERNGYDTKRRMLIIDDNAMNCELMAGMFRESFKVDIVHDGRTALIRMRRYGSGIAVVLLDLIMPGMDGFEVLREMQNNVDMRSIPVIVVSGEDDKDVSLRAIKSGASDYVTKPVDPDLIRLRVQAAISKTENERLRAQNGYLQLQGDEESRYRIVLESTGTVVIEQDWVNSVFTYGSNISKYIAGRFDSRPLWRILLSDMVADTMSVQSMQNMVFTLANDKKRNSDTMKIRLKTPANEKHWFRMNVFKRTDDYRIAAKMILTFNDVNDETLNEQKLVYRAERDPLTGLYNRQTFFEKARELIDKKSRGCYVMSIIDINNFKVINDRFGQDEGDRLLRYLADRLQKSMELTGGLCCRLNADVFAALQPYNMQLLERVSELRELALADYSDDMELTSTTGRYLISDLSMTTSAMLDRAMLAQKTIKGKYNAREAWYDETLRVRLLEEQEIVGSMETALEEGQFDVWFQPQYDYETGALTGAEALARWIHPEKGVISPATFIPVFEKNGFISRMDAYMWEKTCQYLRSWLDDPELSSPISVSVNISRLDIYDPRLCAKLTALMKKYDLPLERFHLEITESAYADNAEKMIEIVRELQNAGFIVEMDDFGSGYSSFNTLKDVPVDVLKIDLRFLSGEDGSGRGGNILSSILRMSRWLETMVIAEGVETKKQADYLKSIGCVFMQGFYFAKPMPRTEFEALLRSGAADAKPHVVQLIEPEFQNFWDLNSQTAMLFNSLSCGAEILEYSQGRLEPLRINDRGFEIIGASRTEYDEVRQNLFDRVGSEALEDFLHTLDTARSTGKTVRCEVRFEPFHGADREYWLEFSIRFLSGTSDNALYFAMFDDVTERRAREEALRRENEALTARLAKRENA